MNNEFIQNISSDKGIRTAVVAVLVALALFLVTAFIGGLKNLDESESPIQRTVTVQGTGKVTAIPNIARISFSVTETAQTVAAAQETATERINKALAYLEEQEIAENDIKTTSYNVYPKYEYPNCAYGTCPSPRLVGYEVSQSIEVKVRNTDQAGDILQGLGSQNVENISGPNFGIDDVEELRAEAREKAVADARMKAKALGKDLKVRLGKVVSFYEDNYAYPMYDKAMSVRNEAGFGGDMAMPAAPGLPTGENEYTVNVSVTYEIK